MAGFKNLPNDLIIPIVSFLDVSALLPFSLINKHIHEICQPKMCKSQAAHKKWKSITLTYKWEVRLVDLLIKILDEPECVRYIRECDTNSGEWAPPRGPNVLHLDVDWNRKENLDRLRESLMASPLLDVSSLKQWTDVLDEINESDIAKVAAPPYQLIWSLLPDLHTIEIPTKAQDEIPWLIRSKLGPKLKKVHFGRSTGYELAENSDVEQLLRLPSLLELNATSIKMHHDTFTCAPTTPQTTTSPLVKLSITSTALTADDLSTLLHCIHTSPMQGLQSFTYTHQQTAIGPHFTDFIGPALVGALATHAQHSLTELDLAIQHGPYTGYYGMSMLYRLRTSPNSISLGRSLKAFWQLRCLSVGAEMLVQGWCMRSVGVGGMNVADRLRTRLVDDLDYDVPQICLGEMLPGSLVVLRVLSKQNYWVSQRVVEEKLLQLLDLWYHRVPLLRVLELNWWPEQEWHRVLLLSFCRKLGVQLVYDLDPNW